MNTKRLRWLVSAFLISLAVLPNQFTAEMLIALEQKQKSVALPHRL
jgi:hypothetical protein